MFRSCQDWCPTLLTWRRNGLLIRVFKKCLVCVCVCRESGHRHCINTGREIFIHIYPNFPQVNWLTSDLWTNRTLSVHRRRRRVDVRAERSLISRGRDCLCLFYFFLFFLYVRNHPGMTLSLVVFNCTTPPLITSSRRPFRWIVVSFVCLFFFSFCHGFKGMLMFFWGL